MSFKESFRAFESASFFFQASTTEALRKRLEDPNCKTVLIEVDPSWVLNALPAYLATLAFSVELGLKYLLEKNSIVLKRHDLNSLFLRLPSDVQATLRDKVEESSQDFKDKFDLLLKENSLAFEQWRYFHEHEALKCNKEFLGRLLVAIHNLTLSR